MVVHPLRMRLKRVSPYVGYCLIIHLMAVALCPHCGREVELDEGVPKRFECPHCGKELGEKHEENEGGWFLPWICLVALFGIIILDSLMNPDTLKKDQSFWESLISRSDFGFWNLIVSVIIFILLLLYGALALLLPSLPDGKQEDEMQIEIDNEFDELVENAIAQSEQIEQSLKRYEIIDVDEFFNLNRTLLALSLIIIIFGGLGAGQSDLSTTELVLWCGGVLVVFLITAFIEIRALFPSFRSWEWLRPGQDDHAPVVKAGVGIGAGIAFIAIISFGWPALLVLGIVLMIYAATKWANT